MRTVIDALGRTVELGEVRRVVSLVPSLTELLFVLGAGARVVGVSDFCLHPEPELRGIPRVGGQKDPDHFALLALAPDVVIVAKEENLRRDVERLERAGVAVYATDVKTVDEALRLPGELAAALGDLDARPLTAAMTEGVAEARRISASVSATAVTLVWRHPLIGVGLDTYASSVLATCGVRNLLTQNRYPKLAEADITSLSPSLLVLPSEPYPFTHADAAALTHLGPPLLVDGTVLCWYGPRTARLAELATLIGTALGS